MNTLQSILAQPLVTALGWALIHFIWQGALVALLLASTLAILPRRLSNTRYAVAGNAMLLMLILPLVTLLVIRDSRAMQLTSSFSSALVAAPGSNRLPTKAEPAGAADRNEIANASLRSSLSAQLEVLLPWMILVWLLGVAFFSVRLLGGYLFTRRLKSQSARPADKYWLRSFARLRAQLKVALAGASPGIGFDQGADGDWLAASHGRDTYLSAGRVDPGTAGSPDCPRVKQHQPSRVEY